MYRSTVPTRRVVGATGREIEVVDFAAIVTIPECQSTDCDGCEHCELSWWTPRTAHLLHRVAETDFCMMTDDPDDTDPLTGWFAARLPRAVLAKATTEWIERFMGCYADLILRMEDGEPPFPRCTGEEMALHMILTDAKEKLVDYDSDLPSTHNDFDFAMLEDVLFDDHDFLMFFHAPLDGIDADATLTEELGLANLRYADWFTPFYDHLPVPPIEAGFEREGVGSYDDDDVVTAAAPLGAGGIPDIVVTTTRTVVNTVTDPKALFTHAMVDYGWPLLSDLDDIHVDVDDDIAEDDSALLSFLFDGPSPAWASLTVHDRLTLCQGAVGWIGGSSIELLEVPGAPELENLTSTDRPVLRELASIDAILGRI